MNKQNKYYDDNNINNQRAWKLQYAVKVTQEQLYADTTTCTDHGT